jgi:hypothetical protein
MTITRHNRFWKVLDTDGTLICLTVYRKGAQEVVRRLLAHREAQQEDTAPPPPSEAAPGDPASARAAAGSDQAAPLGVTPVRHLSRTATRVGGQGALQGNARRGARVLPRARGAAASDVRRHLCSSHTPTRARSGEYTVDSQQSARRPRNITCSDISPGHTEAP